VHSEVKRSTSLKLGQVKDTEALLQRDFRSKEKIDSVDIQGLFFAFLNRSRFKYGVWDVFHYIAKCLCITGTSARRREESVKRHFLFEKAEEKLAHELDVIRIMRTLRKFKMLAQALLNQRHRLILRFQRQNLIETSSSSSDSDINLYEPIRLMESQNPLVKLVAFGNVKKMMKQFKDREIEGLECNMMRGMFRRKLKDFHEELSNNRLTILERLQ